MSTANLLIIMGILSTLVVAGIALFCWFRKPSAAPEQDGRTSEQDGKPVPLDAACEDAESKRSEALISQPPITGATHVIEEDDHIDDRRRTTSDSLDSNAIGPDGVVIEEVAAARARQDALQLDSLSAASSSVIDDESRYGRASSKKGAPSGS